MRNTQDSNVNLSVPVTEAELGLRAVAPRVHQSDVDAAVRRTDYYTFPATMLTVCVITLKNGYAVTGEAACASPANFQQDIGERIARENAYRKIWPLLGFLLMEKLHIENSGQRVEHIARVSHEINRAYCAALGDTSQAAWEGAPDWQKASALAGVQFHIENPDAGPEASHVSWLKQKEADGWKYGPVKDADKKEHPCFMPYDGLPAEQRAKDYLFRAVVHSLK